MAQDMQALGRAVRLRRGELGMSQDDVTAAGGPSATTLSKIETGEAASVRMRTAIDLDRALGWEIGSSMALLSESRQPIPIPDAEAEEIKAGKYKVAPGFVHVENIEGESAIVMTSTKELAGGGRSRVELIYRPGERPGKSWRVDLESLLEVLNKAHDELEATTVEVPPRHPTDLSRSRTSAWGVVSGPALRIPMPDEPGRPTPQPDSAEDTAER